MKYILIILITAAIFGRPSTCVHKEQIAAKVASIVGANKDDVFYGALSNTMLSKYIVVHNFFVFSVGEINGQVVSVGAFRLVYVRSEILTLKMLL